MAYGDADVHQLHIQTEGIGLQFVEIHQLVDESEHPFHTMPHDTNKFDILCLCRGAKRLQGSEDHCQWRAQLVGNIGKILFVDLIDFLNMTAPFFELSYFSLPVECPSAIDVDGARDEKCDKEVYRPCPP